MLSISDLTEDAKRARQLGADGYIAKETWPE